MFDGPKANKTKASAAAAAAGRQMMRCNGTALQLAPKPARKELNISTGTGGWKAEALWLL